MIKILIIKRWFSIEEYNKRLKKFDFHSYEGADKPQAVPARGKKMPGKAISLWIHMRNFPLIIRPLVQDGDDEVLHFALLLADITSRLTAAELRGYEVEVLDNKIIEYLDERKRVFENYPELGTAKPKHHIMTHYGQAIRLFGPPLVYWTARFESKHRVSKNIAESAKNFKNISLTVSVRQQMRMASVYYRGMFETNEFTLPEKVFAKNDLPQGLWRVTQFMNDEDLACSEIVANHQKYEKGNIVVVEVIEDDGEIRVGAIETIVVKKKEVFLVIRTYNAVRMDLGYYKTVGMGVEHVFLDVKNLADFKPLIMHGTTLSFAFVLHHHLSYSQK